MARRREEGREEEELLGGGKEGWYVIRKSPVGVSVYQHRRVVVNGEEGG